MVTVPCRGLALGGLYLVLGISGFDYALRSPRFASLAK
jgi:hypothetical protein